MPPNSKRVNWRVIKKEKYNIIVVEEPGSESKSADKYIFFITRLKDKDTSLENLLIECYFNTRDDEWEKNGEVNTNIFGLERELHQFINYGVVFDDLVFERLYSAIRGAYHSFDINYVEEKQTSEKLETMLLLVGEYIGCIDQAEREDQKKKGVYYIPVAEFDKWAIDCGYIEYEFRALREKLKHEEYIRVKSTGRLTALARIDKKVTRVLVFDAKKIEQVVNTVPKEIDAKPKEPQKNKEAEKIELLKKIKTEEF